MKFVALLTISLIIPVASYAFPAFPMAFWGNVTINGNPTPINTVIRAYYGSTLAGQVVVKEAGIYGYTESTKQKLLIGEGAGTITFTFQSASFNGGNETGGNDPQTYSAFSSGNTVRLDLAFTVDIPQPPSGGASGGGSSSGSGGGGSSGGGGGGGGGGSVSGGGAPAVLGAATSNVTGDADGNGKVDIFDFNLLMINWGQSPQNTKADLDSNGVVDIFDFNLLMIHWV